MKQATSFRLSTNVYNLLRKLADKENRSLTNMLERLIIDRAREEEYFEKQFKLKIEEEKS